MAQNIGGWLIRSVVGSAILFFAATTSQGQAFSCQPVDSTGLPYAIIVDDIDICGGGPGTGDRLCLLDGDLAVGEYTFGDSINYPISITAWQADPAHGLDGFESGNPIVFSFYSVMRQELMTLQVYASIGDGNFGTTPYTRVDSLVEVGYSPPVIVCPDDPANIIMCGNEVVCVSVPASNYDSIKVENGAYIDGEVCFPIGAESRFYTTWVVAYNDCGVDSCAVTIDPVFPSEPTACFANPSVGESPFDVLFVNCSSPFGGVSYRWSFGDGASSTDGEPRHVYEIPGCYDVTLIVSNQCYADTLTIPDAVCVGDGEKCIQIDLTPDWNLISWNVAIADSIQTVFADVMPCVDVILGYNNGGLTYDPLKPQFSDLLEADYRHGYWVRMNCPDTLVMCDSIVAVSTGIDINDGWNLISYLPSSSSMTTDALATVPGTLDLAFTFDGGILAYNPSLPGFTSMIEMRPGLGFWIRTVGSGVLWYPGFSGSGRGNDPPVQLAAPYAGPNWFSVYAEALTLDGKPMEPGTQIEFRADNGELIGATIADGGALHFTPIYGENQLHSTSAGLAGETVQVWVNDDRVYPDLLRPDKFDRIELPALRSTDHAINTPDTYKLEQNYPNPFNPSTRIDFSIPQSSDVRIDVYNLMGQRVSTIIDRHLLAGSHFVIWRAQDGDGNPLPSGLYVYRVQTANWTATKKMTLLR